MTNHASNLRRTRADMLGTLDEEHYIECHDAALYIEQLEAKVDRLVCLLAERDVKIEGMEAVWGEADE